MGESTAFCVYCKRNSAQVPLIQLEFNGEKKWICPPHLPILIHKPEQLLEEFPGMESLDAPTHPHN
jgi:hypothetical protein